MNSKGFETTSGWVNDDSVDILSLRIIFYKLRSIIRIYIFEENSIAKDSKEA